MANTTEGGRRLSERHWRDRYEQLAEQVGVSAAGPARSSSVPASTSMTSIS